MIGPFALPMMIVALRKDAGLTQSDLARQLGVTSSAVHQVERVDHPVGEAAFIDYSKALGFGSELDALERGVNLLRAEQAAQLPKRQPTRKRKAPASESLPAVAATPPRRSRRQAAST